MKLEEIIKAIGSSGVGAPASEAEPAGYSIDSRTVRPGDLFFAIRGERYDGHDFVTDALGKGALAAVVSRGFAVEPSQRLIPVEDTLAALQSLASSVLKNWKGREVAITGSMGKTTTKEMTAATLAKIGSVIKTTGNFNNAYGLPLSILKMESDGARASQFDYAVFEMGMNHAGEIAELTRIAPPHVGAVTVVAPVHLEFFRSVDEIAGAKAEMVAGIRAGGVAVLNADDERVRKMREMRGDIEYRMFGIENRADVRAERIVMSGLSSTRFSLITPRGQAEVGLPLAGRHNVYNALAAAAVADYYEAPLDGVAAALGELASPRMRGEVINFDAGYTIIDDSYNSNPRALVEMVTTICAGRDWQRRIVVAGEMLELGATGAELHREAGRKIAELGADVLMGVRGLAREMVEGARDAGMSDEAAVFYETADEAAEALEREAQRGDLILVKGSRSVRTDIVVSRMKQRLNRGPADQAGR